MTLRDCKKLQVGDKFRKPSTNGHDNGWRNYRVVQIEFLPSPTNLLAFTAVDQHGYQFRVRLADWKDADWNVYLRNAERVV